jgi:hypothetical protein
MGLMPEHFWSLTVREFWIKHRAFVRQEDRWRALVHELAAMTHPSSETSKQQQRARDVGKLRRYPMKKWLDHPS